MQFVRFNRERRVEAGVVLCALLVVGVPSQASAQQPVPGPSQAPPSPSPAAAAQLPAYRTPVMALAQPVPGAAVQQDRPVIVFRFAQGEPSDPIDTRTFAVAVDGEDRTALFQVAALEAWGPLAAARDDGGDAIAAGPHQVAARVCSSRGACATTSATVMVVPPVARGADADQSESQKRPSVLDRLISITRKLLLP
jgi:hypothetical protein